MLHDVVMSCYFHFTPPSDTYTLSLRDALPIFCDLDSFKSLNDQYGHPAGDEVLKRVADLLRGVDAPDRARESDVVARYGGDDRTSTRLNSNHCYISYAVYIFKKKKKLQLNCHF